MQSEWCWQCRLCLLPRLALCTDSLAEGFHNIKKASKPREYLTLPRAWNSSPHLFPFMKNSYNVTTTRVLHARHVTQVSSERLLPSEDEWYQPKGKAAALMWWRMASLVDIRVREVGLHGESLKGILCLWCKITWVQKKDEDPEGDRTPKCWFHILHFWTRGHSEFCPSIIPCLIFFFCSLT